MTKLAGWPAAPALGARRPRLDPLRVDDARDMAPLLDDPALHAFVGRDPASRMELEQRYQRQVVGRVPGRLRGGSTGSCVELAATAIVVGGEVRWES